MLHHSFKRLCRITPIGTSCQRPAKMQLWCCVLGNTPAIFLSLFIHGIWEGTDDDICLHLQSCLSQDRPSFPPVRIGRILPQVLRIPPGRIPETAPETALRLSFPWIVPPSLLACILSGNAPPMAQPGGRASQVITIPQENAENNSTLSASPDAGSFLRLFRTF